MKLLLDQNISRKLVSKLGKLFPETSHVVLLEMHKSDDIEIWKYAKKNNFVIVTQDSDFYERSLIFGHPPKIIWIRSGNTSTDNIFNLLSSSSKDIVSFGKNKKLSCLQIY